MESQPQDNPQGDVTPHQVVVVGPNGSTLGTIAGGENATSGPSPDVDSSAVTDLVSEPAKVMRIGSMIKQLLDEVKSAPLDEAARARLR